MASPEATLSALEQLAAAYNRHPNWVTKCLGLWEREFSGRTDGQLDRALRMWIRCEPRAPTVADIHGLMDGEAKGPLGLVKPDGCPDCELSGWRYAAWHRMAHGRLKVGTYALPCTCPLGEGLGQRSVARMEGTLAEWDQDPATIAVYVTDRTRPTLTSSERGTRGPRT
jgi:hypothetical protein